MEVNSRTADTHFDLAVFLGQAAWVRILPRNVVADLLKSNCQKTRQNYFREKNISLNI